MSTKSAEAPFTVLVILVSTRPGRLGTAVADWFIESIEADATRSGVALEIADLAKLDLPFLDEPEHPSTGEYVHQHSQSWSRQVAAADAVVIVTPEYNHGIPAPLKNALDYLYQEWAWKPVGFVSYGNTSAGTRAVQMAKQVVTTLRMLPIGATVAIRIADDTHQGRIRSDTSLTDSARDLLTELVWVGQAMAPLHLPRRVPHPAVGSPVAGLMQSEIASDDLAELLVLQRCCWVQEARANDTLALAPLQENLEDLHAWVSGRRVWGLRDKGRLVAAVGGRSDGSTWHIERLMVAPDKAGRGIGSWLLAFAEQQAPAGTTRVALSTGVHSRRNVALYQRAGYELRPRHPDRPDSVQLTKSA